MTREKAMKELKKLFGPALWWRVGEQISSPERRAGAKAEAELLKARIELIDAEVRRLELESGITELYKQRSKLRQQREYANGYARYFKFSVGKRSSVFIEERGEGDTWQEAIDNARAKRTGA